MPQIFCIRCMVAILVLTIVYSCPSTRCSGQDRYELHTIKNSKTFSQAIAINDRMEVIGTREVTEAGVGSMLNFFRSGEIEFEIPVPKDFTNIEVQALSNSSVVVGYVSRPIGHANGSLHAFAWDANSREMTLLAPVVGDMSANAQDISADGKRITGYSLGTNPPSMRPCVWQWNDQTKQWTASALSTIKLRNPYLQTSHVVISPNGKRIAACITEKELTEPNVDSSLFVWESDSSGEWQRRKISDEQFAIKDMNDHGVMVGSIHDGLVFSACSIDLNGKLVKYKPLANDESCHAYGVNNAGMIIGMSDDPHGGEGGPQAVKFSSGKAIAIPFPEDTLDSSALAINQSGAIAGFILRGTSDAEVPNALIAVPLSK